MKRAMREVLTHRSMITMANWSEAEIPEGIPRLRRAGIWQLKIKL